MSLNPYLNFNGDCEAAFQFYAQSLNAKIVTMMKHAGTPAEAHVPPEWLDKIMHARLELADGSLLMGSDAMPKQYEMPKSFAVALQLKDTAEAERVFAALSEGGSVTMPIQKTFWAARFGMFRDRFGIPWMVNCE